MSSDTAVSALDHATAHHQQQVYPAVNETHHRASDSLLNEEQAQGTHVEEVISNLFTSLPRRGKGIYKCPHLDKFKKWWRWIRRNRLDV